MFCCLGVSWPEFMAQGVETLVGLSPSNLFCFYRWDHSEHGQESSCGKKSPPVSSAKSQVYHNLWPNLDKFRGVVDGTILWKSSWWEQEAWNTLRPQAGSDKVWGDWQNVYKVKKRIMEMAKLRVWYCLLNHTTATKCRFFWDCKTLDNLLPDQHENNCCVTSSGRSDDHADINNPFKPPKRTRLLSISSQDHDTSCY